MIQPDVITTNGLELSAFANLSLLRSGIANPTGFNQHLINETTPLILSRETNLPKVFNPIPLSGLSQLINYCSSFYPDQGSTIKLESEKSFVFHGGSEPLDVIHIYRNEGNHLEGIPRHWHYVSFGLSDIHNYTWTHRLDKEIRNINPELFNQYPKLQDQVYPSDDENGEKISGFGFELTIRVKCDSFDNFPRWPIDVMQSLARYVFQTTNPFGEGDHCMWHRPISDDCRIEHFLMTVDQQLDQYVDNISGKVRFIQLVGVFKDELNFAQGWSAKGILDMMREHPETGGKYLVTDSARSRSLFEQCPDLREKVLSAKLIDGSDMNQICKQHKFSLLLPEWYQDKITSIRASNGCPTNDNPDFIRQSKSALSNDGQILDSEESEKPKQVYLLIDLQLAKLLPIILNGRLAHGKPFVINNPRGDLFTTFIPEGSTQECFVTLEPFGKLGSWLQIYISDELRNKMSQKLSNNLDTISSEDLPKSYCWKEHGLYITIVERIDEN